MIKEYLEGVKGGNVRDQVFKEKVEGELGCMDDRKL